MSASAVAIIPSVAGTKPIEFQQREFGLPEIGRETCVFQMGL